MTLVLLLFLLNPLPLLLLFLLLLLLLLLVVVVVVVLFVVVGAFCFCYRLNTPARYVATAITPVGPAVAYCLNLKYFPSILTVLLLCCRIMLH